jgi:spore germination protein
MTKRAFLLIALFVCLLTLFLLYRVQSNAPPSPLNRVAAWMPTSWDSGRARASWEANRAHIQELSPVWYQLDAGGDGSINAYAGARDVALVNEAHFQSTLIIPLINNHYVGSGFDAAPVSTMIHDPARCTAHIAVLVNETLAYGYDGIDVDYESLNGASDRDAYSQFTEGLAAALHAQGKLLSVAVHPKTREPGSWNGPQAEDWARIGAAADRFRVMTYGYHWDGSGPGPIAPLWWMDDVMDFATSVVPPNRVYVGLHFYGQDWAHSSSGSLAWEEVQTRISASGVTPQWRDADGWRRTVAEPWFAYSDDGGHSHEVWYADEESIAARLELVSEYGLGGIAVWRLGGEDPANWSAIATTLHRGVTGARRRYAAARKARHLP